MTLVEPDVLARYRPRAAWYHRRPTALHGPGHAARVLVWAEVIAAWMTADGCGPDPDVVRWAAVLHDVRRRDDARDPDHGRRAAAWIQAGHAPLDALTIAQRRLVAYCCAWHADGDDAAPDLVPELVCLKDADALDRVRVGGARRASFRTRYGTVLLPHAEALWRASRTDDPFAGWSAARDAASALGWHPRPAWRPGDLVPRHLSSAG
jgi:hypothetical protein